MVQVQTKGNCYQTAPAGSLNMGQNPRASWRQQNLMLSRPSIGAVLPALAHLPAEVSLVRTTPTLPALQVQHLVELSTGAEQGQNQPNTSSVLVADGISPIPSKVLEKIRRWEYIDLAMLLANDTPDDSSSTVVFNGQALVVSPSTNPTKKRKIALDIQSWSQAYSMYAAALISADSTTKPESAGLLSHMFSVLQLAKDLGGSQWLYYDKSFREWAAAKNVRELNLPIFFQCMTSQQRVAPFFQLLESGPKGGSSSVSGLRGCRAWNLRKHAGG